MRYINHNYYYYYNGTYCLLVRRSAFKNGEGKLNTRTSYQWTNPLLYLSLHFADVWPRVIETEIGAALCAMFGAERTIITLDSSLLFKSR